MAKRVTNIARFAALVGTVALNFVPNALYSQPPNGAAGEARPAGGRGRGGRGPADPNVNQFRTIDNVKYVDGEVQTPNSYPTPYHEASWPQLPAGRKLGGISAIAAAPNGHIWVADRCSAGMGACTDS